jgi:ATP-dependent Lhr-like helicase
MNSNFNRLSPFIREYIYRHNWNSLNEIQEEACRIIFDTDMNSCYLRHRVGKNRGGFFACAYLDMRGTARFHWHFIHRADEGADKRPVLSARRLVERSRNPGLLLARRYFAEQKERACQKSAGVLQITPESLESMLLNRNRDLVRLFGDLRFCHYRRGSRLYGQRPGNTGTLPVERLQKLSEPSRAESGFPQRSATIQ